MWAKIINLRHLIHIALLIAAIGTLLGCQSTPYDKELEAYKVIPTEQDDAGYASSSVVAIMSLDVAKTTLPSNVSLTFENALKEVQHFARAQERAKMDSLQFGLNVGLSSRGLNSTSTSSNQDSIGNNTNGGVNSTATTTTTVPGTTTSTDQTTTVTSSVNANGVTQSNSVTRTITRTQGVAGSVTFAGGTPSPITSTDNLSRSMTINPALAYQAADQLIKITGMMREQFQSIPHNSATESVYVVQVKTSLQPYKPLLPLDAYVNLTVLPDLSNTSGTLTQALLKNPPRLVPLAFGSEEYEFSSSGVSENYLRGLSLGLTASAPGGAVNAGLQKMLSSLMRTYATDVNGLIVTTPMSPNTVQVRLGAMWQGNAERAMIPRSFNGFFALIVPKVMDNTGQSLSFISKPFFRDPKTGSALFGTAPKVIIAEIQKQFEIYNLALKDDCVYATGTEETLATPARTPTYTINLGDDWFAFLNRIRRNDLEVLKCVGVDKGFISLDSKDKTRPTGAQLIKPSEWPEKVTKPVPAFVLEKFVGSLNRVALMERHSYSQIFLPSTLPPKSAGSDASPAKPEPPVTKK
jgi:hypothetical protein